LQADERHERGDGDRRHRAREPGHQDGDEPARPIEM
jgi:hypothetical protein